MLLSFPSTAALHRRPILSSLSPTERRARRKKLQPVEPSPASPPSAAEKGLRLAFMEELMTRARAHDPAGVADAIRDMVAAGLRPGPRSYHGLVVSYAIRGDEEGAMQSLRRELSAGLCPLHETFISLVRLFGSKGHSTHGLEILAAMEKLNYDIRRAWLILVEELVKNKHLEEANRVFLKGAEGGLRATDELYDLLIVEDCKAGDHSNALTIAREMEAAGRMATTFHFNCLLSVQATCGIPEIAFATFENMEYGGEDYMKPDTETYNWVIQAYTRAESYDRVHDVIQVLGIMLEDHKRLQPNAKTYALLVECFTKYSFTKEAIRHFRALKYFPGGTKVLYNEGDHGDPLSLYLRALCREGRIVEMLEVLETMSADKQPIPPRAMILNRKYRSLVSSWIEPLQEEAYLGFEIDYFARYVTEGGLTGERKRWVPRRGKAPLDPDAIGFAYSNPRETSFRQRCLEEWRLFHSRLLRTLHNEGSATLGEVTEYDLERVTKKLVEVASGEAHTALKPKSASKMTVGEFREELKAQGLPIDGTRSVLYQRVQKARRINRSRNRPLWVPQVEEKEEEVDEDLDELITRIKLEDGNTEFWRHRFLGEDLKVPVGENIEVSATSDVQDTLEDDNKGDDEEPEEEGLEVEQSESQVDEVKGKKNERVKHLEMIGVQLLKDSNRQHHTASSESGSKVAELIENDEETDVFPDDVYEAFKVMRERKIFEVSDMYTIADAWGWTWERELMKQKPQRWSLEWESELATKVMEKVIELGGTPTIEDCAMVLHAATKASSFSSFLGILRMTHNLGYTFGGPLYDKVISSCLDFGELDAAVAIVADMETAGIAVPDETLDRVLAARQGGEIADKNDQ